MQIYTYIHIYMYTCVSIRVDAVVVAVCCSVLHVRCSFARCSSMFNVLQCAVAVERTGTLSMYLCCSVLQCVAVWCSALQWHSVRQCVQCAAVCCDCCSYRRFVYVFVLQCVAVCCMRVAVCCSVLQWRSVL